MGFWLASAGGVGPFDPRGVAEFFGSHGWPGLASPALGRPSVAGFCPSFTVSEGGPPLAESAGELEFFGLPLLAASFDFEPLVGFEAGFPEFSWDWLPSEAGSPDGFLAPP